MNIKERASALPFRELRNLHLVRGFVPGILKSYFSMNRGTRRSSTEDTMNTVGFLTQQALSNNGSGVHHLVNGEKRPAGEMEECTFTQFNPQHLEIDEEHADLSDDDDDTQSPGAKKSKKTKGRVKIKMEFIENKLRRYTTFSKRKTGIMKKVRYK